MNLIARTGQIDIDSNKRKSAWVNFPVRATEHALHESHVRIDVSSLAFEGHNLLGSHNFLRPPFNHRYAPVQILFGWAMSRASKCEYIRVTLICRIIVHVVLEGVHFSDFGV
jgi:hypothetical protein